VKRQQLTRRSSETDRWTDECGGEKERERKREREGGGGEKERKTEGIVKLLTTLRC